MRESSGRLLPGCKLRHDKGEKDATDHLKMKVRMVGRVVPDVIFDAIDGVVGSNGLWIALRS